MDVLFVIPKKRPGRVGRRRRRASRKYLPTGAWRSATSSGGGTGSVMSRPESISMPVYARKSAGDGEEGGGVGVALSESGGRGDAAALPEAR
jgi:hypothetical protein